MNKSLALSLLALPIALAAVGGMGAAEYACCEADSPAGSSVSLKPVLTLEGANRVLEAAINEARKRNAGGAIAVVDDGGNLIAFQRVDGTFAAGAEVSIGKARTAALFKKPTRAFEESINKGRTALVGVNAMTPLQGGIPIERDGAIIGAIGVSGAHSQGEDEEIALAGAAAVASSGATSAAK
ncbi:MAG: heme-binding protein [Phycisphaeraceae bacterium]|nr:heme-binding protein [Phycisphaeraceae bacterium]